MQKNYKPCPICGSQMRRQSKTCRKCYYKKAVKPENYISKNCPVCENRFTVHKSQIERGQGKYCSRSCARSGSPTRKRNRASVNCRNCGEQFDKNHSEINKNIHENDFCCPECWYEYNQGENHYGYEGGQDDRVNQEYSKWRKSIIKRDHGYCRLCHAKDNLEVHHIHRFATYPEKRWDIENGITLCHDCHVKFRHKEDEYIEELSFIAKVPVEVWHV